ncbi:MAG: hypothetical protein LBG97_09595, partial [Coriobacteriales bacterium]|nr:hypothetical protein [Coriobacteriales bacterium]
DVLGAIFFFAVFFAALTSAISLAETVVSFVMDRLHWPRRRAAIVVFMAILLLAMPPTLGFSDLSDVALTIGTTQMSILDIMDFFSNSVLMPLVALLICIFVGYWIGPDTIIAEVESNNVEKNAALAHFKSAPLFRVMIRYVAPVLLLIILVSSVLNGIGVVSI